MIDKVENVAARGSSNKIVFERTYRATVQELWELWTTKEGFESWWGPEGFRVEVHSIEPRANGKLHYDMIADAPEMVAAMKQMGRPTSTPAQARFAEFRPLERLVLTHVIDFVPGVEPYDSTILVEFFPSGEWVRMVATVSPMHDEAFTKMSVDGFTSQLAKLDKRFAQAK
jgi:uncharacterized protein YndB with AHSA1/START domain